MKKVDFTSIIQAIAQIGFPIVIAVATLCWAAYYIDAVDKRHREQITEMNNAHKEELKGITDALENNTLAIQKLTDLLEKEKA